jgi:hypothetical protein
MKKLQLIIFFIITVFSANAQDKPNEKETVQLIEEMLNDSPIMYNGAVFTRTYSIKETEMYLKEKKESVFGISRKSTQYKDINWAGLVFDDKSIDSTTVEFYCRVGFYVGPSFSGYTKQEKSGEIINNTDLHYLEFYVTDYYTQNLINAFLRLKEIYTEKGIQK